MGAQRSNVVCFTLVQPQVSAASSRCHIFNHIEQRLSAELTAAYSGLRIGDFHRLLQEAPLLSLLGDFFFSSHTSPHKSTTATFVQIPTSAVASCLDRLSQALAMFVRYYFVAACTACFLTVSSATTIPTVVDSRHHVTYQGLNRNGVEAFLNIPYAQDTGGKNRFKPPKAYVPSHETIKANAYGPACPQPLGGWVIPISLTNVTEISEDCLNLNVVRPKGTSSHDSLPVMIYIHGGSFWAGQNQEITINPDGMILESVKNGLPIIHVAMNYRLGCKWPSCVSEAVGYS